jgi:medium-chain acyl-[acyl-carrier-protein] hydrolase
MDYQCSKKFYVGYSDVDSNDKCRLSRILDLCQNIATIHSESLGYGTKGMMDLGWAWLVTSMKIRILKYPVADKEVEIQTWSRGVKGIGAKRGYEILDEEGNTLVLSDSSWALYDLVEKKLVSPSQTMIDAYGKIDRDPFEGEKQTKIKDTEVYDKEVTMQIEKRDIDTNMHVNNARYLDYIMEVMPDDLKFDTFECSYKKQIKYGEKIKVSFGDNIARIKNEMDEVCFIVKFS